MRGDRQKTVTKCCLSEAETDRNANIPCRSAGIWEFAPEIFAPPTGRTATIFQSLDGATPLRVTATLYTKVGSTQMSVVDPRSIMVIIGGMGMVAQALAAWWWFKVSSHEFSDEVPNAAKELREIGRLNARAAIAQSIASTAAIVLWLTGAYVFSG